MKKPLHERIAATKERRAQLDARLAVMESKAKAKKRKDDTRRKIVVGAAVLVEMEREPKFAAYVRKMLGKAVTRPQDKDAIADLLQAATEVVTSAVNSNTAEPTQAPIAGMAAAGSAVTAREKLTG